MLGTTSVHKKTSGLGAWLALSAMLLCRPAAADLFSAGLAYEKGDYDTAFKDYRELAEIGQPTAQFNIAVMYAKGQGVAQSDADAYAWALLAQENGYDRATSMVQRLHPTLTPDAQKIADGIHAQYGRAALDERIMPQVHDDELADAAEKKRCAITKAFIPEYPTEANRQGIQGAVYIEYTEMPDGTSRNPRVIYSIPQGLFSASAREGVLRTRFGVGQPGDKPIQCTMFYNFTATGQDVHSYVGLQERVKKTLAAAQAGDVKAQVLYGYMLVGLPQLKATHSEALPWFLKAAQAGTRIAQYQVGYSLLKGWGCNCDEGKGLEWLRKAAEADEPEAQVALAIYALHGTPKPDDFKRAGLWLERAVAHDSHDGKLYLSAVLASAPESEMRDPKRALTLLDQVFKEVREDPTVFEIRAAAQASAGAFPDAMDTERKAIAMAGRLKWDLAPLNERLAHYQSKQPWYGDLLSF